MLYLGIWSTQSPSRRRSRRVILHSFGHGPPLRCYHALTIIQWTLQPNRSSHMTCFNLKHIVRWKRYSSSAGLLATALSARSPCARTGQLDSMCNYRVSTTTSSDLCVCAYFCLWSMTETSTRHRWQQIPAYLDPKDTSGSREHDNVYHKWKPAHTTFQS
ncbi:hypothetical protein OBBRIDRAFT_505955 [Obba rivulosa]|uniref:Uncharacterized protein n=1 Tax=Obba rivulosa TaxID=1052685 RepID=A0A8E2AWU3_9APHY|nr:hypothetical protein OBBRIDRAFT_505955 [Obba rivulosa]